MLGSLRHRLRSAAAIAVAIAAALAASSVVAAPASAEDPVPLPSPAPGVGLTAEEVAEDPALFVADDGAVFARDVWPEEHIEEGLVEHTDAAPGSEEVGSASAETAYADADADVFTLHSRPGSDRTIYLDFHDGVLQADNTWLKQGLTSRYYPGWSTDGSSSFSAGEQAVIREVWARVAEDFAPFDIDVTTVEPPAGGLWRSSSSDQVYGTRVAFSSGSTVQTELCGGGCGGIAWVGTFDMVTPGETRSPAWVFPSSLGNRAKNLAEAAAHEVGHNLGLRHDATHSRPYYSGTSLWGPIMGSPYGAAVTQWSRGEYADANNQEDDLVTMSANGANPRADEAGSSAAGAAHLSTLVDGVGVLTSENDADWFVVSDCSGTVSAQVDPAQVGANVDLQLEVRDAAGSVLARNAPVTRWTFTGLTGMSASVSMPLSGGPYYVAVAGAGSGEDGASAWSTGGYGPYGSIGTYQLTVAGCSGGTSGPLTRNPLHEDPATEEPLADDQRPTVKPSVHAPGASATPRLRRGARGGRLTVLARWAAPTETGDAAIDTYRVRAYRLNARGRVVDKVTKRVSASPRRAANLRLPRGRWVVRVRAHNQAGWGPFSRRSAAARPR